MGGESSRRNTGGKIRTTAAGMVLINFLRRQNMEIADVLVFLAGIVAGGLGGALTVAICVAAKKADKRWRP